MTPASFEPTIDYVVTKVPRWAFEKLPGTSGVLGTQMQSVGEAMAIGRTFAESLQKGFRSLETGRFGLNADPVETTYDGFSLDELVVQSGIPTPERPFFVEAALRRGASVERVAESTGIDPWFLDQIGRISDERARLESIGLGAMDRRSWRRAKRFGFSDGQLALPLRHRRGGDPPQTARGRGQGHLQDRRHVWRRVRRGHALPLRHLRGRG